MTGAALHGRPRFSGPALRLLYRALLIARMQDISFTSKRKCIEESRRGSRFHGGKTTAGFQDAAAMAGFPGRAEACSRSRHRDILRAPAASATYGQEIAARSSPLRRRRRRRRRAARHRSYASLPAVVGAEEALQPARRSCTTTFPAETLCFDYEYGMKKRPQEASRAPRHVARLEARVDAGRRQPIRAQVLQVVAYAPAQGSSTFKTTPIEQASVR